MKPSVAVYLVLAIASGLGLVGKMPLLKRVLPWSPVFLILIMSVALLLPLFWAIALRFKQVISVLTIAALGISFFIMFPKVEKLHQIGRGSDQPDCVIVAGTEMMSGHWPYQRDKMWTKNPMSCGPGWVAIQAPIIARLDYRWDLAILWALSLAGIIFALGWDWASEVITLSALCPGVWLAASDGTDFLTFGICITALFLLSSRFRTARWAWAMGVGLVAQFRFPTLLVPSFMTKQLGTKWSVVATAIAFSFQGIFLFWNAPSFISDGPLHVISKFTHMHLLSTRLLPVLVEILIPLIVSAAVAMWIDVHPRTESEWTVLAYLTLVLGLPAIFDLIAKVHSNVNLISALGLWEGGLWLTACLPLAALLLTSSMRADRVGCLSDVNA